MGIEIVITSTLFEPIPEGANQFGLRDATARSLSRQPETALSHGIAPWSDTAFNGEQVPRLLQEIDRVGRGHHCYVVFLGD